MGPLGLVQLTMAPRTGERLANVTTCSWLPHSRKSVRGYLIIRVLDRYLSMHAMSVHRSQGAALNERVKVTRLKTIYLRSEDL